MVYTFIIALCILIALFSDDGDYCEMPAKMWLGIHFGGYSVDLILINMQLKYLKKHRKESLCLMGMRFLTLTFLVGWLVYGNMLYYIDYNPYKCSNGVRLVMFLVLVLGYFEMLKCFCVGLVICIMVPFLVFAARRAQRPNWIPAAP
jgi:integral membrane sensor domain MASE1